MGFNSAFKGLKSPAVCC